MELVNEKDHEGGQAQVYIQRDLPQRLTPVHSVSSHYEADLTPAFRTLVIPTLSNK
jgi:hypothetical protein